jgi:copper chaperone CopZ
LTFSAFARFNDTNQQHNMTTIQNFATNINCSSCVRSVTPFLDDVEGVTIWRVNVEDERKVLTVEGSAPAQDIMKMVEEAGFDISPLN